MDDGGERRRHRDGENETEREFCSKHERLFAIGYDSCGKL
jgi:hypothetical protein